MDARAAGVFSSSALRAARAAFASQYSALCSGIDPDYPERRVRATREKAASSKQPKPTLAGINRRHFRRSESGDHAIAGPYRHPRAAPIHRRDLTNDRVMRCRHDRVGMGGSAFVVEQADGILGHGPRPLVGIVWRNNYRGEEKDRPQRTG